MTVNFHIGAPRIGSNLLKVVSSTVKRHDPSNLYILPQRIYRDKLRSVVNRSELDSMTKSQSFDAAEKLLRSFEQFRTVAASQHALLGSPEEVASSRKKFPRIAARVANLSDILGSQLVTLHLSITSQTEYLLALDSLHTDQLTAESIPTWAELVRVIQGAAPKRRIIVWDFESPKQTALAFLISLLETDSPSLIHGMRTIISDQGSLLKPAHAGVSVEGPSSLVEKLDAKYEQDLDEIEAMEGVTLVRPESIPDELFIE